MTDGAPGARGGAPPPRDVEEDHDEEVRPGPGNPAGGSRSAPTATALEVLDLHERRRRELVGPVPGGRGRARPGPARVPDDATLAAAGRWLRELHESSGGAPPGPGARRTAAGGVVPDGSPGRPGQPLRDLGSMALTLVPLTAREVPGGVEEDLAGDGSGGAVDGPAVDGARDARRAHRLQILLEAYGWDGGAQEVLASAREGARQHAVGLRSAAARRHEPAITAVADGVAGDLDRAVGDLGGDVSRLSAPEGTSTPVLGRGPGR